MNRLERLAARLGLDRREDDDRADGESAEEEVRS